MVMSLIMIIEHWTDLSGVLGAEIIYAWFQNLHDAQSSVTTSSNPFWNHTAKKDKKKINVFIYQGAALSKKKDPI